MKHDEAISRSRIIIPWGWGRAGVSADCHYAYHLRRTAVLSLHEIVRFGAATKAEAPHPVRRRDRRRGSTNWAVLLYGHEKNRALVRPRGLGRTRNAATCRPLPETRRGLTGHQRGSLAGKVGRWRTRVRVRRGDARLDHAAASRWQRLHLRPVEAHLQPTGPPLQDPVGIVPEDNATPESPGPSRRRAGQLTGSAFSVGACARCPRRHSATLDKRPVRANLASVRSGHIPREGGTFPRCDRRREAIGLQPQRRWRSERFCVTGARLRCNVR